MYKKGLILAAISFSTLNAYAAYPEIQCSSNTSFTDYSCNQCFDGGEIKSQDNISFLDDLWINDTLNDKVMFKTEQKMPKMYELNGAKFSSNPSDENDFWEYTTELNGLKNFSGATTNGNTTDSFVLPGGKSITWIKSTLGAAYRFDSIPDKGKTTGILTFDIKEYDVSAGVLKENQNPHRECVLFKSGELKPQVVGTSTPTPKPQEITKVKTGPELYFVIIILSFLLSMVFMNRKTLLTIIRK